LPKLDFPDAQQIADPAPSGFTSKVESTLGTRSLAQANLSFSSGEVQGDYLDFPERTSGKVFFTDASGTDYACSGTAISSENESVVWTAGHCVNGGASQTWVEDWVFIPAYRDGTAPYGMWHAKEFYSPVGWTEYRLFNYDVAAVVVDANDDGQRLADVIGGRGIAFNMSPYQTFDAFGYPGDGSFTGERMYWCRSELETLIDDIFGPVLAIGCDMTHGSSGGGLIVLDEFVNSNISAGSDDYPNIIFAPYLGDAAESAYEAASSSAVIVQQPDPVPEASASTTPSSPVPTPSIEQPTSNAGPLISFAADTNDSPGGLDIEQALVGDDQASITLMLRTYEPFRTRILNGHSDIYFDFDISRAPGAETYVWIRMRNQKLIGSVEKYRDGQVSRTLGYGLITKIDNSTVQMTFPKNYLDVQKTIRWYASTRTQMGVRCRRVCWDKAPNGGFISF
jgi:V8-like Glu-specific endopeptidase